MSAVKDRASAARVKSGGTVRSLPQVNLLPPEVRAARSLAVVKRWLVLGLVLVIALVALVYAFAHVVRSQADGRLADAETRTADLRAEERKYIEVPQVLGAIEQVSQARLAASSGEIVWKQYLDALTAVMPEGVRVVSLSAAGPSLGGLPAAPVSPLDAAAVGSLTFEAQSQTLPDTSAMLDALASVPGFQDPWASSISITESEGVAYYTASFSVQLAEATLAQRFQPTEGN